MKNSVPGAVNTKTIRILTALTLGVCVLPATALANDFIPANAPITYKMSKPGQHVSAPTPSSESFNLEGYTRQSPVAPSQKATLPQQAERVVPDAAPTTKAPITSTPLAALPKPAQQFDFSRIDRQLYKHMKVGRPYTVAGKTYRPAHNPDYDEVGEASWYGDKFHGKPTANGEKYDKFAMTAAHKTLPLNSYVIVTNLETGKTLKLRLNDRGPFIGGRIIDLSEAAARELGIIGSGLGQVRVQYAGPANAKGRKEAYAPLRPQAKAKPKSQAKLPAKPQAPQTYKPLRKQAQNDLIDRVSGKINEQPILDIPDIMKGGPRILPKAKKPNRQVQLPKLAPIPQAGAPKTSDDGIVTLTIKGPIHMADHSSAHEEARVIPAVYRQNIDQDITEKK